MTGFPISKHLTNQEFNSIKLTKIVLKIIHTDGIILKVLSAGLKHTKNAELMERKLDLAHLIPKEVEYRQKSKSSLSHIFALVNRFPIWLVVGKKGYR